MVDAKAKTFSRETNKFWDHWNAYSGNINTAYVSRFR
jgi:hypothetical protein